MTLGEKIIDLRKKRGLSQEDLAITLGVSRQAVSKWETGEAKPDTDKVIALAEYFEVTTDWLLRDIELQSAPAPAPGGVPSVKEMLRGAPMLLNLTIGGNVFGAALMLYDLWQQTYYHIPIIVGLFIQIGMCALFLGLCSSIRPHDPDSAQRLARPLLALQYFLAGTYALLLGFLDSAAYPCAEVRCFVFICSPCDAGFVSDCLPARMASVKLKNFTAISHFVGLQYMLDK